MKIGKLKKLLNTLPDTADLFVSCDSEGNSYYTEVDVCHTENKKAVVLYPSSRSFQDDDAELIPIMSGKLLQIDIK